MRILLDECLPRQLRRDLAAHEVRTVQELGWAGTRNGALLRRAAAEGFVVFVTVDGGIEFQQRVADLSLGIIALTAPSNDVADLRPLMPAVLVALQTLRTGTFVRIP